MEILDISRPPTGHWGLRATARMVKMRAGATPGGYNTICPTAELGRSSGKSRLRQAPNVRDIVWRLPYANRAARHLDGCGRLVRGTIAAGGDQSSGEVLVRKVLVK